MFPVSNGPRLHAAGAVKVRCSMALASKVAPINLEHVARVLAQGAGFQACLHALFEELRLPALSEMQERAKHAEAYETTAGVLRRRALKADGEEREEHERRAVYYEGRAFAMRSGQPMPRELRTPRERLDAVGRVRDALVEVLDAVADVDGADFAFFEESLLDERGFLPPRGGSALEQVGFVASVARGLLARMGAVFDERGYVTLLPYGTRIAMPGANAAADESSAAVEEGGPSQWKPADGATASMPPPPSR
jgi:hypothetical protein